MLSMPASMPDFTSLTTIDGFPTDWYGSAMKLFTAILPLSLFITGCALFGNNAVPPTAAEKKWFDVSTNYAPIVVVKTNVVTVFTTNQVMETVWKTNHIDDHQTIVTQVTVTNPVPVTVTVTNTYYETNGYYEKYTLTPGAGVRGAQEIGGAVASPWGASGIVSGIIGGIAALYAGFRNRALNKDNKDLDKVAGGLAQAIETYREVVKSGPQGEAVDAAFKQWLIQHQAETQTISRVAEVVADNVNNLEAKHAAQQISALVNPTAPK